MGIISGFVRGISNAKRALVRTIGAGIEKFGDAIGNLPIAQFGFDLQFNNFHLEKQIDLNSTDTSVEDTIEVHRMCERARNEAARQAKKYENDMFDKLQEKVDEFLDQLAEIVPDDVLCELDYDIGDAFADDIHNTVSEYVSTYISQDSEEFVEILNMDDSVRNVETDKYIKKVLQNAVEKVQEKCQRKEISIYKKMLGDLERYFAREKNYAEEVKNNMEALKRHKSDMEFCEDQAIHVVADIAYMECIRTLTYSNSKP